MAYTFAVDIGQMDDLVGELDSARTSVNDGIEGIFTEIGSIGESDNWKGSSYDEFKSGTDNYRDALNNVPEVIDAFKDTIQQCKEPAQTAITEIETEIGNIGS